MTTCSHCHVYEVPAGRKDICYHCIFQGAQFFEVAMLLLMQMCLVLGYVNTHVFFVTCRIVLAPIRVYGFLPAPWVLALTFLYWVTPLPLPFWLYFTMCLSDLIITLLWSMGFLSRIADRPRARRGATEP